MQNTGTCGIITAGGNAGRFQKYGGNADEDYCRRAPRLAGAVSGKYALLLRRGDRCGCGCGGIRYLAHQRRGACFDARWQCQAHLRGRPPSSRYDAPGGKTARRRAFHGRAVPGVPASPPLKSCWRWCGRSAPRCCWAWSLRNIRKTCWPIKTVALLKQYGFFAQCWFYCFNGRIIRYLKERYGGRTMGYPDFQMKELRWLRRL